MRSTLANFPHFSSKKPLHIMYNDLFYRRRKDISKELNDRFYQGYADRNLIAKWKKYQEKHSKIIKVVCRF